MNRRSFLKALVLGVTLISGVQPAWAGKVLEQTVLDAPLYDIAPDGTIDLNTESDTGYGLITYTERRGMLYVKYSWSGEVLNESGKTFHTRNPADYGDLFMPVGAGEKIDHFEYQVTKHGKATLYFAAHAPIP